MHFDPWKLSENRRCLVTFLRNRSLDAILLALAAAFLFAVGNQSSRVALRYTDSRTATLYQIVIGTALYWLASPFFLRWEYWLSAALPMLAAIGLFRPILSANLGMAGTRLLGPTISSTLSATAPLFGVLLGVALLGEVLTWEIAVGAGGIFVGVVMLSWHGAGRRDWALWALLLPVGAAALRAIAHAFAKIGMESVPSPFFVALVAYSVSLVLALAFASRGNRESLRAPHQAALPWLVGTGLAYGLAVLCLNSALLSGRLIVVSPIVSASPLFTLALGLFIFKEKLQGARTILAVFVVVLSVLLIVLSK